MGLYKSIKKRRDWLTRVSFDKRTGFYLYTRENKKIYIRHPRHFKDDKSHYWTCEQVYFHHYMPQPGDLVVDFGAGYGEEAAYLAVKSPGIRYLGVEPQPVIYECLANTFHDLGDNFIASPYVVTQRDSVKFISQFSYASVGEVQQAYIDIPTISWDDFISKYNINKIDLLKMNIEGAEVELIAGITDYSKVKRVAVSCHDFRANYGDGEYLRTKQKVLDLLQEQDYEVQGFNYGIDWADDWLFAARRDL